MTTTTMSKALPILGIGAALLFLARSKRTPDDATTDDDVEADAQRIIDESRDIIQGKADSYSDDPGTKVDPRKAAERVKETVEAVAKKKAAKKKPVKDKTSQVADIAAAELAQRAAEEAAQQAALEETKKPAKPGTKSLVVKVKQAQQQLNVLGYGLVVDSDYGPLTARAWNDAATKRGKPGAFVRKSASTATVAKAAADAIADDAAKARAGNKVPPKPEEPPTPEPSPTPTPAPGPTPPAGFDREKANRAAPDVAKHIRAKKFDYNRAALRTWQKLAGIAQDGHYGRGSAAALRYYVGATAPKALFAQGDDYYPWG